MKHSKNDICFIVGLFMSICFFDSCINQEEIVIQTKSDSIELSKRYDSYGNYYFSIEKLDTARILYDMAIAYDPGNLWPAFSRAQISWRKRNHDLALKEFNHYLSIDTFPGYFRFCILTLKARCFIELKQFDSAVETAQETNIMGFERGINQMDSSLFGVNYNTMAEAFYAMGQLQKTKDACKESLKYDHIYTTYEMLAMIAKREGNLKQVCDYYKTAVSLDYAQANDSVCKYCNKPFATLSKD